MRHPDADSLNSLPIRTIEEYSSTPDNTVEKLLVARWERNLNYRVNDTTLNYFFQSNAFHFYDPQAKKGWLPDNSKEVLNPNYGGPFLKVDDVNEIVGHESDGYFVFTNDSVFYFIPPAKGAFQGPFTIHNVKAGRRSIMRYDHDNSSTNKFFLYMDERDNDTKILFLPDSNLVISNYGVLEDSLINSTIQKGKTQKMPSEPTNTVYVLATLLGISTAIIIWLARQKRI